MKKILSVIGSLNTGGLQTVAINCMKYAPQDFCFDYVVFGDKVSQFEKNLELEYRAKVYHITSPNINVWSFLKEFSQIIKNTNYDIVHSHIFMTSGPVLMISKINKIPVRIAHAHSMKRSNKLPVYRKIYYSLCRILICCAVTKACACSEASGRYVFGERLYNKKGFFMPNCIDVEKFKFDKKTRTQVRNRLGIGEDIFLIGMVSRFEEDKNQSFLVDVLKKIENPHIKIAFIGDGSKHKEVEKKVNDLLLEERVLFLGNRNDVNVILNSLDLFVLTSRHEGFSLVIMEALANGLTCFAEMHAIPKEIKEFKECRFVDGFCVDDWVREIKEYICYAQIVDRMAPEGIDNYDIQRFAGYVRDLYLE
ncbi:MAG: glycosyltransferase family 1 protein [Lachnospiraceae bacterium]|jgi:glycosyltransferase EpsF|nr:glycosyltransferase family 1 protein [Lachnospiraceae bacterium]